MELVLTLRISWHGLRDSTFRNLFLWILKSEIWPILMAALSAWNGQASVLVHLWKLLPSLKTWLEPSPTRCPHLVHPSPRGQGWSWPPRGKTVRVSGPNWAVGKFLGVVSRSRADEIYYFSGTWTDLWSPVDRQTKSGGRNCRMSTFLWPKPREESRARSSTE